MNHPQRPRRLFRLAPTRRTVQREIDDEMQFHLQARIDDLVRSGHDRGAAEHIARREFGDVGAARAELVSIDRRRLGRIAVREWLSSLGQDVRFALRGLRARPGFSLTILLTLALGIGANAAIFSVVDAVLLRQLPFANPERLVHLWEYSSHTVDGRSEASYPDYLAWRERNRVFSDIGGYQNARFLVGADEPVAVNGTKVTWNFFNVLGVRPIVGRTFVAGEDDVGAAAVIMITSGLWERQFGRDPAIAGKHVMVDGAPATIIGVLPPEFHFRDASSDVWRPIDRRASVRTQRGNHWLNVVGRLRTGVSVNQARRDMSSIMRELAREFPPTNATRDAEVVPLRDELVGSVRPLVLVLYGAVAVMLLVACVNVANLLLMRGTDRSREIAVRAALGAGRGRLMRQFMTESVLLGVLGGAAGLLVARIGLSELLRGMPAARLSTIPGLTAARVDGAVILYGLLLSIVAALAFGALPALRATRADAYGTLRHGGRGASRAGGTLRDWLVAAEIALTVTLVCGAALFARSLINLMSIEPGFRTDHLITARVLLPDAQYTAPRRIVQFYQRLGQNLHETSAVQAVGLSTKLPLDVGNTLTFAIAGRPEPLPGQAPNASYRMVNPEYFSALGIPIVEGRAFTAGDDSAAPPVVVINRALAARDFPGEDPVGHSLIGFSDTPARIVGVVGDVPIGSLEERIPPTMYFSFAWSPQASMHVAVRVHGDPDAMIPVLRNAVRAADPQATINQAASMDDLLEQSPSVFMRRFPLMLISVFAIVTLVLAMIGVYGVIDYSVAQRTREMGIRMALGAPSRSVVSLVMRQGLRVAGAGVVAGIAAAVLLGRFVSGLLYGVGAHDPAMLAAAALMIGIAAIAATLLPARRATRVDPVVALRAD
jgi:putative ABC transport system permease protein